MDRRKLSTFLVVLFTVVLAGVAVFTAVRLYQQRSESVAPTAPTSIPRAQETNTTSCSPTGFTLAAAPQCGSTCSPSNSASCPQDHTCDATTLKCQLNTCRAAGASCDAAKCNSVSNPQCGATCNPSTPNSCPQDHTCSTSTNKCVLTACTESGKTCDSTNCTLTPKCGDTCSTNTDCPTDHTCDTTSKKCELNSCRQTGASCTNNNCTPVTKVSCNNTCNTTDKPCQDGLNCVSGQCRNPSCTNETDCTCGVATVTPKCGDSCTPGVAGQCPGDHTCDTTSKKCVLTACQNAGTECNSSKCSVTLPNAGTSYPTVIGLALGILAIIGALAFAL